MLPANRNIIVAIDDSEYAEFAFDFYIQNIHKAGDNIILLHVPEYGNLVTAPTLLTDPNVVQDLLREEESKTRGLVEKYSIKMKNAHVSGHVKQRTGKIGETILSSAKEENATLIVVGTRGMGKMRRTFLGSVSDYLIHHAGIPVLVCRNKEPRH